MHHKAQKSRIHKIRIKIYQYCTQSYEKEFMSLQKESFFVFHQ